MPSILKLHGRDSVIGRWALIRHADSLHVGTVLDKIYGTNLPNRIRIQRGAKQGEVVQPSAYEFRGFLDDQEIDP